VPLKEPVTIEEASTAASEHPPELVTLLPEVVEVVETPAKTHEYTDGEVFVKAALKHAVIGPLLKLYLAKIRKHFESHIAVPHVALTDADSRGTIRTGIQTYGFRDLRDLQDWCLLKPPKDGRGAAQQNDTSEYDWIVVVKPRFAFVKWLEEYWSATQFYFSPTVLNRADWAGPGMMLKLVAMEGEEALDDGPTRAESRPGSRAGAASSGGRSKPGSTSSQVDRDTSGTNFSIEQPAHKPELLEIECWLARALLESWEMLSAEEETRLLSAECCHPPLAKFCKELYLMLKGIDRRNLKSSMLEEIVKFEKEEAGAAMASSKGFGAASRKPTLLGALGSSAKLSGPRAVGGGSSSPALAGGLGGSPGKLASLGSLASVSASNRNNPTPRNLLIARDELHVLLTRSTYQPSGADVDFHTHLHIYRFLCQRAFAWQPVLHHEASVVDILTIFRLACTNATHDLALAKMVRQLRFHQELVNPASFGALSEEDDAHQMMNLSAAALWTFISDCTLGLQFFVEALYRQPLPAQHGETDRHRRSLGVFHVREVVSAAAEILPAEVFAKWLRWCEIEFAREMKAGAGGEQAVAAWAYLLAKVCLRK